MNIKFTTLLLIVIIFLSNLGISQCDNGTNYYPSTVYTPDDNIWGSATTYNYAGEIIKVNIVSGDEYQFSTCSSYGGVTATYDTQLTLIDELGSVVDFNDDFSGCGLTSYIKYTATYTGVLYVHLNEYNCASNSTSTEVRIYKTPVAGGSTDEVTIGDPNSTLQNGRVPAYGYYDYSWSAAIYTATELGGFPRTIEKISWNVTNGNSMTLNNQEIWIAHTLEEEFPDGTMPDVGNGPWNGFVKVFSGSLPFSPGWNEIVLNLPFNFNGSENLLIKVVNNHGSWASSYPEFQYTSKANSVVYNYDDGSFPPSIGYRNSYRPNTRFGFSTGNSLPIVLVSFEGENLGNYVKLEWVVASQVNNDYYTIEKSLDAYDWEEISMKYGAGNTNQVMTYITYDENPNIGHNYYRLTQTDFDGVFETFNPIAVTIKPERKEVISRTNLLGQEVDELYSGISILIWDNGDIQKIIK